MPIFFKICDENILSLIFILMYKVQAFQIAPKHQDPFRFHFLGISQSLNIHETGKKQLNAFHIASVCVLNYRFHR